MATHKVPQDVEAEDKLVGFLSLKQFIFVIFGIAFGWLTFFFATKVHPLSALIWIPPTIVCLVLGLYQRKDQPAEVFLASAIRFYLKPHTRKWDQEGYEERVIITAPPKFEKRYTKNFTSEEASSRLHALSHLMDSRGWTTKIGGEWQNPQLATAAASERLVRPGQLRTGVDYSQYMEAPDMMDENTSLIARGFQSRIDQTTSSAHQHALQAVQGARSGVSVSEATQDAPVNYVPTYQPYPQARQKTINPSTDQTPSTAPSQIVQPQAPTPSPPTPPKTAQPKKDKPKAQDGTVEIKLR